MRWRGPDALNLEQDAVGGTFRTCQTCWGVEMDAERGTVRTPERRISQSAHLRAGSAYEPGDKRRMLSDLQELRGTAHAWTAVHPGLGAELGSLDGFLGPAGEGGGSRCRL